MLETIDKKKLKEFLHNDADGWSLYDPEMFTKMGFTPEELKPVIHVHKSDRSQGPKGVIFDKHGQIIQETTAIYSLDFLYWLARKTGADTTEASSKMGRGFQAQCLVPELLKKLESLT